jgi:hypothetical protein
MRDAAVMLLVLQVGRREGIKMREKGKREEVTPLSILFFFRFF